MKMRVGMILVAGCLVAMVLSARPTPGIGDLPSTPQGRIGNAVARGLGLG